MDIPIVAGPFLPDISFNNEFVWQWQAAKMRPTSGNSRKNRPGKDWNILNIWDEPGQ